MEAGSLGLLDPVNQIQVNNQPQIILKYITEILFTSQLHERQHLEVFISKSMEMKKMY